MRRCQPNMPASVTKKTKQYISAETLFSLPICVIKGETEILTFFEKGLDKQGWKWYNSHVKLNRAKWNQQEIRQKPFQRGNTLGCHVWRRLLTDSNLEKSALRGCRRGKGSYHNLSGKRTDQNLQGIALLRYLLFFTAIRRMSGDFCFVRLTEYF